jgi:hypothetical protein
MFIYDIIGFLTNTSLPMKKNEFGGKIELNRAPLTLSEKEVYYIMKDINVIFGKNFENTILNGM